MVFDMHSVPEFLKQKFALMVQCLFKQFFVIYADGKRTTCLFFIDACACQSLYGGVIYHTHFGLVSVESVVDEPTKYMTAVTLNATSLILWLRILF